MRKMSKRALKLLIEILKLDLKRDNSKLNRDTLKQDLEYYQGLLND